MVEVTVVEGAARRTAAVVSERDRVCRSQAIVEFMLVNTGSVVTIPGGWG